MNSRAAVKCVLAFCAALGLGRWMMQYMPAPRPAEDWAQAVQPADLAAVVQPVAATSPEMERARATSFMYSQRTVDRDLKVVDGGVQNENIKMNHFMASNYAEGTLHKVNGSFGEMLRWLPQTQELRRGKEVVAVLGSVATSQARVEKIGSYSRVVYPATYPLTDERMYIRPDGGIEHDIVLEQPPEGVDPLTDLAYTGYLQLSNGLTLWDGKYQITGPYTTKNEVYVRNAMGNNVLVLRRPVAWDAAVTAADGSFDIEKQAKERFQPCEIGCEYQFAFDDSGVKLAIVTSGRWLTAPTRTYPVTIDPNTGPLGLADGDPALYMGAGGTDTIQPVHNGGVKMPIVLTCPFKPDDGYGIIPIPFPFTYYGLNCALLEVHINGFARFVTPTPPCPTLWPWPNICNFDTPNGPLPSTAQPNGAIYPYWDDLRFGPGPTPPSGEGAMGDPGSGIYYTMDGSAPNRRLVIEWYKMAFVGGQPTETITFNAILYECNFKIQFLLLQPDEDDMQSATIGIEDFLGSRGIQYDYNSRSVGQPPLTPGTSVIFTPVQSAGLTVTPLLSAGCIPHNVCFQAQLNSLPSNCGLPPDTPTSYSFRWIFGDGTEAFTPTVCHTFVTPGFYNVLLQIRNDLGVQSSGPVIQVRVCDVPAVIIGATPQGGPAPLIVQFEARTPDNPNLAVSGQASWIIDLLGLNNEPGVFQTIATMSGNQVSYRFDVPGTYRVTGTFAGTDLLTGLPTAGVGTVFIFVTDPSRLIEDDIMITESKITIDWKGKIPAQTPQAIPPNPNNDTIFLKGIISLPGITQSDLIGRRVRVALNGIYVIFESILDANGNATQGDPATGRTGTFSIKMPSGDFTCTAKGNLYGYLGLTNATERRMIAEQFRIEIEGLFPIHSLGPILTYDYSSVAYQKAHGTYKFGRFANFGKLPGTAQGTGVQGGLETLLSGGFQVTKAKIKLAGNSVYADLQGLLARSGGDSLLPADNSDVVVSLGNFSEALNFTTTPTFKTSGKPPTLKFTFKRSGGLGSTGIANFQWTDRAGTFKLKTFALPNELVGINPALAIQTTTLGLTVTPESNAVFSGLTRFQLNKKSETQFVRGGRK
jgi:hypothetical protein